jgi:hypothetical protein
MVLTPIVGLSIHDFVLLIFVKWPDVNPIGKVPCAISRPTIESRISPVTSLDFTVF